MAKGLDVVIVGGGIIGLAGGYFLSRKKKRVLVIDKGGFADGASGACDDMILFQSKKPGINLELTFESLELYKRLIVDFDDEMQFKNLGGMVLIENDAELAIMEQFVAEQRSYGLDVEVIGQQDARKKQPFLSDHIIASTYSMMDSQIDPFHVMRALEKHGLKLGMGIQRRNGVVAIERLGNGNWSVVCEDGSTHEAPVVVNAAGAWAPSIAQMVGATVPIVPKRGQIVLSERIPPIGETNLWNAKYLVTKLHKGTEVQMTDEERELGLSLAFTRSAGNTYLMGSTREYVGYDKGTTIAGIRGIIDMTLSYLPKMKDVGIVRAMAGLRPETPDGKMILGEHKNLDGFYTAAGHEGDGIALAPVTAKLLSDLICGNPIDRDLGELSPNRFGGMAHE
ncbi:MAG: FAD-binding oxidoreductase [Sphaerochaeta sp.]|jgi:sarcosine oxidase subunit beta|nr:FAD-binding oxidoreductase [Sphaerochaeta sp.]MDX9915285.1 FAD-binding oxidoreductase [Sphaerochaeta sp.]